MTDNFAGPTIAAGIAGSASDREDEVSGAADDTVETVGRDDAAADAARSGADVDTQAVGGFGDVLAGDSATTDSDGVPVGAADADADAIRSGADVDDDV